MLLSVDSYLSKKNFNRQMPQFISAVPTADNKTSICACENMLQEKRRDFDSHRGCGCETNHIVKFHKSFVYVPFPS